ncbi:hypothetical protein BDL97_06G076300 [Sphagnum fallax]|nr:hypothetical protein BDL97_06G076300 [Sphagnum fallax]
MASSSSAYSVAAAAYGRRRKRSVMSAILMWTLTGMLMMNLVLINVTPVNAAAKKESSSPGAAALTHDFYSQSCPKLHNIVRTVVKKAVARDPRMAASLLRLEFHDCFVNGCDGSVLLDNTANFTGEKSAAPNKDSLRGFHVIDEIKEWLERECPQTVSCADILAIAARDSVVEVGGPRWRVVFGRRDSLTANITLADEDLPSALYSGSQLVSNFESKGFNLRQMVALSGGHTIGFARCVPIAPSIYGRVTDDHSMNPAYLTFLEKACPNASATTLIPLDDDTPAKFDSSYYTNLLGGNGALHSDRDIVNSAGTALDHVQHFAKNQDSFFDEFAKAMVVMSNIQPLTGSQGEIRTNCRFVNAPSTASKAATVSPSLGRKLPLVQTSAP